jgi:hypothetical protein
MSLLKREAKASPAAETSRRARLVEFVKSSSRKLEAALGVAKWFNEILALLKLLNDLPEGCIEPSGTAYPLQRAFRFFCNLIILVQMHSS